MISINRGYIILGLFVGTIFLAGGCKSERNSEVENLAALLLGRWEVSITKRDNRETKSLDSGFLLFLEDQRLHTNFLNTTDTLQYEVNDHKIVIPSQDIVFNVSTIAADKLVLFSRINKHNLEIELRPVRS